VDWRSWSSCIQVGSLRLQRRHLASICTSLARETIGTWQRFQTFNLSDVAWHWREQAPKPEERGYEGWPAGELARWSNT